MDIKYIDTNIFKLSLDDSNKYTHHRLEYDNKILKLLNKKHVSYDEEGCMFNSEYIFEILNDNPTKIKIKFDFNNNDVEYIDINVKNRLCLIL